MGYREAHPADLQARCSRCSRGSLYPALHRLEQQGLNEAKWARERNRPAEPSSTRSPPLAGLRRKPKPPTGTGFRRHQPRRGRSLGDQAPLPRKEFSRWLDQLRMRILMLFHRNHAATRLDDELAFHLDRQIAEHISAGMTPDEARYSALRTFGNPAMLREQTRANWSWNWPESISRCASQHSEHCSGTPGFALIAITVMALCNRRRDVAFTIVRLIPFRPLPRSQPARHGLRTR